MLLRIVHPRIGRYLPFPARPAHPGEHCRPRSQMSFCASGHDSRAGWEIDRAAARLFVSPTFAPAALLRGDVGQVVLAMLCPRLGWNFIAGARGPLPNSGPAKRRGHRRAARAADPIVTSMAATAATHGGSLSKRVGLTEPPSIGRRPEANSCRVPVLMLAWTYGRLGIS